MLWSILSEKMSQRQGIKGPSVVKGPASARCVAESVCPWVCVCVCARHSPDLTTMARFWATHAEYAWSRRLVPREPVNMWCAYNWTVGQSAWLSKVHFWEPKCQLQTTSGLQLGFANRDLEGRHWNQPRLHWVWVPSVLKIPTVKSWPCPLTCRSCSAVAFCGLPLASWKEGSSVSHFALFPVQHTRALAHLWRYKRTPGFAKLPQTQKYSYLLRGTRQPSLRQKWCRSLQLPLKNFSGEVCLMSYASESITCLCFLTDSRTCKMLLK